MQINTGVKVHNEFDIFISDAESGKIKEKIKAYNIVLTRGLTQLCGGAINSFFTRINFGGGVGTLDAARTTLFTPIGSVVATVVTKVYANPTSYVKKKIVLNPSEFVGSVIKEVGISETSGSINTHALLQDAEGNPISITKTATDVITIYATVYFTLSVPFPEIGLGNLTTNPLLLYLIEGGVGGKPLTDAWATISVGTCGDAVINGFEERGTDGRGQLKPGSTVNYLSGIPRVSVPAEKKFKYGPVTFEIGYANDDIREIKLGWASTPNGCFYRMTLPNQLFQKFSLTNQVVGTGDGVKKVYDLPKKDIIQSSIVIKKNGVAVTDYSKSEKIKDLRGPNVYDLGKNDTLLSTLVTNLSYRYPTVFKFSKNNKFFFETALNGGYGLTIYKLLTDGYRMPKAQIASTSAYRYINQIACNNAENLLVLDKDKWYTLDNEGIPTLNVDAADIYPSDTIMSSIFSPDDQLLLIGTTNSKLYIYKKNESGKYILQGGSGIVLPGVTTTEVVDIKFTPNGTHAIITGKSGKVVIYKNVNNVLSHLMSFVNTGCDILPNAWYIGHKISFNSTGSQMLLSYYTDSTNRFVYLYDIVGDTFTLSTKVLDNTGAPTKPWLLSFFDDESFIGTVPGVAGHPIAATANYDYRVLYKLTEISIKFQDVNPQYIGTQYYVPVGIEISNDRNYIAMSTIRNGYSDQLATQFFRPQKTTEIVFDVAPAAGVAITADLDVPYIPKNANYTLTLGASIQFS